MSLILLEHKGADVDFRRKAERRWREDGEGYVPSIRRFDLGLKENVVCDSDPIGFDLSETSDLPSSSGFCKVVRSGIFDQLKQSSHASSSRVYDGDLPPDEALHAWSSMAVDYGVSQSIVAREITRPAIRDSLAHLRRSLDGSSTLRGLDFGTGAGKHLQDLLYGLDTVYGVDISPDMIRQARVNVARGFIDPDRVNLSVASSIDELCSKFSGQKFPFIFAGSVLMTLDRYEDMRDVLQALNLLLEPNSGRLLVTATNTRAIGALPSVNHKDFGLPTSRFLNVELDPLISALEDFRRRGVPIEPGSEAYGQLQIYGQRLNVGEWGSFPMDDSFGEDSGRHCINRFRLDGTRIKAPRPTQIGEPYVVLGKWSVNGGTSVFRDRFYSPWNLTKAFSDAGLDIVSMRAPNVPQTSSLWRRHGLQSGGQLLVIEAKKTDVRVDHSSSITQQGLPSRVDPRYAVPRCTDPYTGLDRYVA